MMKFQLCEGDCMNDQQHRCSRGPITELRGTGGPILRVEKDGSAR